MPLIRSLAAPGSIARLWLCSHLCSRRQLHSRAPSIPIEHARIRKHGAWNSWLPHNPAQGEAGSSQRVVHVPEDAAPPLTDRARGKISPSRNNQAYTPREYTRPSAVRRIQSRDHQASKPRKHAHPSAVRRIPQLHDNGAHRSRKYTQFSVAGEYTMFFMAGEVTQPSVAGTHTQPSAVRRHTERVLARRHTKLVAANVEVAAVRKHAQPSTARKHARVSRGPAHILEFIHNEARNLYSAGQSMRGDLTGGHSTTKSAELSEQAPEPAPEPSVGIEEPANPGEPISLRSILCRRISNTTKNPPTTPSSGMDAEEAAFLHSQGYSATDLDGWVSCVLDHSSVTAAAVFRDRNHFPPFVLVLLFLRRAHLRTSALGIVMRHIATRTQSEPLIWQDLETVVIRLLRHARIVWPESIPWVVSLYVAQATRIIEQAQRDGTPSAKLHRQVSRFSNTVLSLISLPATLNPLLNATHQEQAQFEVLQFMQSCDPAIVVSRIGFRAVARNQLMHSKTAQESEWSMLKGPSWPPWKEARTAMDDEKGYEFGVSRASRILHRMHEAGYRSAKWEQMVDIYGGWDTDLSPTIQTRTPLPGYSTRHTSQAKLQALLWAGRIRATRTRREAWACFLACEASDSPAPAEAYFAMFEKLHYPEVHMYDRAEHGNSGAGQSDKRPLLPGDAKEVQPDPKSPLHLVYISEPVPSYEQLFHRMSVAEVPIPERLLSFLVATHPHFDAVLQLLEAHQGHFDGGVGKLLKGQLPKRRVPQVSGDVLDPKDYSVPEGFLNAFITFLCRFGRFHYVPATKHVKQTTKFHDARLNSDRHYLLDYAYALLMRFRPHYPPAWTTYMEALLYISSVPKDPNLRRASPAHAQYTIVSNLFEQMNSIDLDPDDDHFRVLCTIVRDAVRAVYDGEVEAQYAGRILAAPRLLRTVFHVLVGSNVDASAPTQPETKIAPHIPEPALLHVYVRTLGILRDYEGLFSFTTWAVNNHAEVTARANAQRSGPMALYQTFLALRASLEGKLDGFEQGAPADLTELVKGQLESVEGWGWPQDEHVADYLKHALK